MFPERQSRARGLTKIMSNFQGNASRRVQSPRLLGKKTRHRERDTAWTEITRTSPTRGGCFIRSDIRSPEGGEMSENFLVLPVLNSLSCFSLGIGFILFWINLLIDSPALISPLYFSSSAFAFSSLLFFGLCFPLPLPAPPPPPFWYPPVLLWPNQTGTKPFVYAWVGVGGVKISPHIKTKKGTFYIPFHGQKMSLSSPSQNPFRCL